eukprot:CAMPEP_0185323700 /NCGR_PEP_ID=MMETSP1363-20130426/62396_1 /TAXON_ID=38817 /ORGANISM="Gephyrocapsa oceanica, Strain RCC1303" /LENGTH=139 /DNA_ID=CAMNT_0027922301 /DNA_START=68 /DNA_END=484 /DNA_ORIENTATION=-
MCEVEETLLHASQPPVTARSTPPPPRKGSPAAVAATSRSASRAAPARRAERDETAQQRAVDDLRELTLGRGAGALRAEAARVEAGGVLHRRNHLGGQKVEPPEGCLLHLREAADGTVERRVEQRVAPPAGGGGGSGRRA